RPFGYDLTFAEMTKAEKGAISHRGKAVKKLILFIASTD
ncbi:MAG: non-canonical purine NTP pyrophosphatase, partial [Flavobacteriales bacterium]|nr:non-canonical purine NTP pyrophosphatase [Flavobacteriales bacterium]